MNAIRVGTFSQMIFFLEFINEKEKFNLRPSIYVNVVKFINFIICIAQNIICRSAHNFGLW